MRFCFQAALDILHVFLGQRDLPYYSPNTPYFSISMWQILRVDLYSPFSVEVHD